MAMLTIFNRGIDNKYDAFQEVSSLVLLKDTTKSLCFYKVVKTTLNQISLTFVSLSSIATDDAAMVGKRKKWDL